MRGGAALRCRGRPRRRGVGPAHSIRNVCSTRNAQHPHARLLAVVHAETSTGVENDIAPLRALQDTDTLLLVDTVTSLGGIPVEIDGWGVDAGYSGTQKCLGVPPGLSPVTFSPRAVERVRTRATPPQSWYLDLVADRQLRRAVPAAVYHHTAPVAMIFSLHAALGALLDEGLEAVVGAPPRGRRRGCRRRCPSSASASSRPRGTGCRSSPPRGCPTAPTTPRCRSALLDLRHRGRRRARRVRGQGLAHRADGPLGPGALGHDAARRPARAALTPRLARPGAGPVGYGAEDEGRSCRRESGPQHVLAVVAELGDRLVDVGERAVRLGLAGAAACTRRGTSVGTAP